MLSKLPVHSTIPASDMERAKQFYNEKLGLEPVKTLPGGMQYECANGTKFVIFPSPNAGSSPNTVAGWTSQNLEQDVAELKKRGVVFEEYDTPGLKTENSVATFETNKAAWFKDSEGNILGIVQFL